VRRGSILEAAATLLVAAGIATPLGVTPGAASAADPKVDLTGCLAPNAVVGDTRVFDTSEGTRLTERVLRVDGWKGRDGWSATVEARLGAHAPTVRETFVKPGRRMLIGDLSVGDFEVRMGEPEGWLPLAAAPGRPYQTRARGKALVDGERVGRAIVEQAWEVVGFEPLTTPTGSYPDTVHIAAERNFELKANDDGVPFRQESDVELWCVDGLGVVAASYAFRFYEGGRMVDEVTNLDSWLVSATVAGARAL
jgi:hypothetical protein